jgi:hypothetical protein
MLVNENWKSFAPIEEQTVLVNENSKFPKHSKNVISA